MKIIIVIAKLLLIFIHSFIQCSELVILI